MTTLVSLHRVTYVTPAGQRLFEDLSLDFGVERVGLIGRNGVGKSTLLRLLVGELTPTSGRVQRMGRCRAMRQTVGMDPEETIVDVFSIAPDWVRLQRIEQGMGNVEDLADVDWTLPVRIQAALAQVGLPVWSPVRRLSEMSGGQRTRIELAALVFDQPDFLILDEPTNHLDREGRARVATLLAEWRGGAVVVSHDRELLERMDRIVELSSLGARGYGGNWSHYHSQKQMEVAAAEQNLTTASRHLKEVERDVQQARERKARKDAAGKRARARGGQSTLLLDYAANRAGQSLGRGRRADERKIETAGRDVQQAKAHVEAFKALDMSIARTALPAGRLVLQFEQVDGGPTPESTILRGLSFEVVGPERVAVSGRNGSGKTTLLRLAAGALQPQRGRVRRLVRAALFDQAVSVLDPERSLLENFKRWNPDDDERACRDALARFLFRADAALGRASELSGGERLRAGLACVLGGKGSPPLLLLDEPTNHLDLESIAAVEAGLNAYDGALLLVSHDVAFLKALGVQRTIALDT
ncbi:MAG: ATP-binding cassette domain-containing protein [Xanthomonadaceae bacterium]|jgi:ATPase subunit of ABC transporter with duplicated ATPase domains|nr:ATP-binding cassette domain-containing protein [Xanthomonadaceae bacterium]